MTPATNYKTQRTYPELIRPAQLTEQEATYRAALELVARIDEDLTRGVRHYRTKAGALLTTLDEVIRAILDNTLMTPEEEETEVLWVRPVSRAEYLEANFDNLDWASQKELRDLQA